MMTATESTVKSRLVAELWRYAAVSLYLFVCFSIILIFEASQSTIRQVTWLTVGLALGQALVLGKFILIGEALKMGERVAAPTFLHRIAWRTLGMLVALIVLKFLEEVIIGLVHSKGIGAIFAELEQRSLISLMGPIMLMLLILVPMIAAIELDRLLGKDGLKGLLLQPVE
jgi:hypothetical protein